MAHISGTQCNIILLYVTKSPKMKPLLVIYHFLSRQNQHGKSESNPKEGNKKSREVGKGPILSGPVLRIVVASATAATLLLLRFKVMGSTLPVFTSFDNPASYEAAPAKQVRGVLVLNVQCFSEHL